MASSTRPSSSLQQKLSEIFETSSDSYTNENGERVISSRSILPVLDALAFEYGGNVIIEPGQKETIRRTIESYPPLDLTPSLMIQLVERLSGVKLPSSPNQSYLQQQQDVVGSSSDELVPVPVPVPAGDGSVIIIQDGGADGSGFLGGRQRNGGVMGSSSSPAPSAWNKRPPRLRGRSETNITVSTREDGTATPTDFRSNSRKFSDPTSPTELSPRLWPLNRPPSSTGSYSQSPDASLFEQSFLSTPIRSPDWSLAALSPDDDYPYQPLAAPSFSATTTTSTSNLDLAGLSLYHQDDDDVLADDEDDSDEETTLHRHQRKHTLSSVSALSSSSSSSSSTSSLSVIHTVQQREEELQRRNEELAKKLRDANREYENKMSDHEADIQELQERIEELRGELQASKREEKELRLKARTTNSQLATLEAEMAKLQRQVDVSRNSYQTLQKQYQEQCALSEKYRNTIRKKDQELKHAEDLAAAHQNDLTKWRNERDLAEANIESLKTELAAAQTAQEALEEQQQANQMLRETIDRLRLDLEEIRTSTTAGSGKDSAKSTVIKSKTHASKRSVTSLAAEMRDRFDLKDATADGVEFQELDSGDDEDEFVETIITTSRKRVGLRRNKLPKTVDESKEFAEASVQHDPYEFTSSIPTQTHVPPARSLFSAATQTSPGSSTSFLLTPSDDDGDDDTDTSSSTLTIVSPSPSPMKSRLPPAQISPGDLPPSYAHLEAEEKEIVGREYLRKFHPGINSDKVIGCLISPSLSMPSRDASSLVVSQKAVEQWMKFKAETGRQCDAIDQVLLRRQNRTVSPVETDSSLMTMTPRKAREWANKVKEAAEEEERKADASSSSSSADPNPRASPRNPRGRFYKLYPSVFYPNTDDDDRPRQTERNVFLASMGFAAMMMMAFSIIPAMKQEYNDAMYTDRQLWASYNSLGQVPVQDGFFGGPGAGSQSATNAVWTLAGHAIQGGINVMRRAPPS